MGTILIADDDDDIRLILRAVLERAGHEVIETTNGLEALRALHEARPDVVLLDVAMPGMDGWQALERIREISEAPVMMLTAYGAEREKVRGLRGGADDYVTKPFGSDEILARVEVVMRRRAVASGDGDVPVQASERRIFDDLEVNVARREVLVAGEHVQLTKLEFDVLDALTASPKRVLTRRELLDHVWGPSWFGDENTVDVHVSKLRRKLGDDVSAPRYIETVRGVGFRMVLR